MPLSEHEYLRIVHALFNLTRAYETLMRREELVQSSGLIIQDLGMLVILGHFAPLTSRQLASMMGLSNGMISIYVQKLVEKGLLQKEQDRDDRRNWWLYLTDKGKQTYQAVVSATAMNTQDLLLNLSDGEQALLHQLLEKAVQNIHQVAPQISGKERIF